jgi:hypothetical protein
MTEHDGFIVHFFDRPLVDRLADGFRRPRSLPSKKVTCLGGYGGLPSAKNYGVPDLASVGLTSAWRRTSTPPMA